MSNKQYLISKVKYQVEVFSGSSYSHSRSKQKIVNPNFLFLETIQQIFPQSVYSNLTELLSEK